MSNFTTNWALYDPLTPKKKTIREMDTQIISKDIERKLKLIKKAFS